MSSPATPDSPIGSAILNVPVDGRDLFGRNSNAATLWLNFEPDLSEAPFSLVSWYRFFIQAMPLVDALVDLLCHGFGLKCWDQPAARIGFMLQTPGAWLTKLVDASDLATLAGANPHNQFLGYAIADASGKPADDIARALIRQICDYGLQVELTAVYLAMIGTAPDPGTRVYVPWSDGRREGTVVGFDASYSDPRVIVSVAVADQMEPTDLAFGVDAVEPVEPPTNRAE